jgi:hypothetical protein
MPLHRDARARPGQRLGDGQADPLHRAGHQRGLSLQIGHVISSQSFAQLGLQHLAVIVLRQLGTAK